MSSETLTISSEPDATAGDTAVVREGLYRFNIDTTGMTDVHTVAVFVRDGTRRIRGGLLGHVWGGWLYVEILWLAEECRGRGLGGQLLAQAEQEAISRGARGAYLSTFDYQAPAFYAARGYEEYATLPDNPAGHLTHHMRKVF